MNSKLIGSILLIVGTSIGAGILGLPIAAAQLGFIGSLILLFVCWFIMVSGAFLILEVNLWLPLDNNLISMAKVTIGPFGQMIAWITYLLLLYSLLCAYISGGSDLFHNLLTTAGIPVSSSVAAIVFTAIFGTVVFFGIRSVDRVNRGLMFVKLSAFILLAFILMFFVSPHYLESGNLHYLTSASALTVTTAAFGWATLIPSLRMYFEGDVRKLKTAILVGSLIPLVCYIIWDAVIMGVIPINGSNSLISVANSINSTSSLVNILNSTVQKNSVVLIIKLFTSICVLTSFLGVALCLTDFFADGFKIKKQGMGNVLIHAITFIPALIIAILIPNAFIKALGYAGIYSTVLLILLPACMAWSGRYRRQIASNFTVAGGKIFLSLLILFSVVLIIKGLI